MKGPAAGNSCYSLSRGCRPPTLLLAAEIGRILPQANCLGCDHEWGYGPE